MTQVTKYADFNLCEKLKKALAKMEYVSATPIQQQAIPLALKGRDILGSAQTGTGKTAAFSIPLVEGVLTTKHGAALVLTPTRELAKQVMNVIKQLIDHDRNVKTAFIIGGEPMHKQLRQLRNNPRIIVGTPGRINDHLRRDSIDLSEAGFLVLDETDRMLDMGFGIQLDEIVEHLPEERQTLMFSATMPKGITAIAQKYLRHPERISIGDTNTVAKNIQTDILQIEQSNKYKELILQIQERDGSIIVFVKTKHGADKMARRLREDGFTADALHGDLRQSKRDKVMRNFREKNFRVLIATDIAARGLDVPHIEHVINYDLPQVAEDYIHRMGRTARAGAEGSALVFISPQESRKWYAIECLLNPDMKPSNDFKPKKKKPRRSFTKGKGKNAPKGKKPNTQGKPAGKKPKKRPNKQGGAKGKNQFVKPTKKGGKKKASKKQ